MRCSPHVVTCSNCSQYEVQQRPITQVNATTFHVSNKLNNNTYWFFCNHSCSKKSTCALPLFEIFRDVHEAFLVETETSKPETEAETKAFRARDWEEAEAYELRGETEPRHYCASKWPRDRGVKTEATFLEILHKMLPPQIIMIQLYTRKYEQSDEGIGLWNQCLIS